LVDNDPEFKKHVYELMEEVVVKAFEKRETSASDFYDKEGDEE
jgi:hypothetical protein